MRQTEDRVPTGAARSLYEPCEECGTPLDPQQRYCVNCAARRGNGANPASRYFAAMSKRTRRPLTPPPAKASSASRAAAVSFFALLPIAVAIGVVIGRSGSGGSDNEALLEALRNQAPVASTPTAQAATAPTEPRKDKGAKTGKGAQKEGGKVVAKTENGTVHQVTGFKPSAEKEAQDTKLVESNPEQVGENYIKAQQNLPDVIVVGGDPNAAPAAPTAGSQP
jgi:hypothetical protein